MPTRGCESIFLMMAPEVGGTSLKARPVPEASMKFSLAEKNPMAIDRLTMNQ
jgi:hypothetical protein